MGSNPTSTASDQARYATLVAALCLPRQALSQFWPRNGRCARSGTFSATGLCRERPHCPRSLWLRPLRLARTPARGGDVDRAILDRRGGIDGQRLRPLSSDVAPRPGMHRDRSPPRRSPPPRAGGGSAAGGHGLILSFSGHVALPVGAASRWGAGGVVTAGDYYGRRPRVQRLTPTARNPERGRHTTSRHLVGGRLHAESGPGNGPEETPEPRPGPTPTLAETMQASA